MKKERKLKTAGPVRVPDLGEELARLRIALARIDVHVGIALQAFMETTKEAHPYIITAVDLAELLHVRVGEVRRWAREGKIPHSGLLPNGDFMFDRDSVLDFLRAVEIARRLPGPRPPKGGSGQSNI